MKKIISVLMAGLMLTANTAAVSAEEQPDPAPLVTQADAEAKMQSILFTEESFRTLRLTRQQQQPFRNFLVKYLSLNKAACREEPERSVRK